MSLNFMEFLKALDISFTDTERVKNAYSTYLKIGGYPGVVKEYKETESVSNAVQSCADIRHSFCNESVKGFSFMVSVSSINDLMRETVRDMSRGVIEEDKKYGDTYFLDNYTGLGEHISDHFKSSFLSFLIKCCVVSRYDCDEETSKYFKKKSHRYFFNDLGFLETVGLNFFSTEKRVNNYILDNFVYIALRDGYFEDIKFLLKG